MSKLDDLEAKRPKTGGRQPGTPNRTTAATREQIAEMADPVGFLSSVVKGEKIASAPVKDAGSQVEAFPTLDQRISAARVLADKLLPNARSRPITLMLPSMEKAAELPAAIGAVLASMASGSITPDEAATIAGVMEQKRRAIETVDILARLEALEAEKGKR